MNQAELEALLGRPLTPIESANVDLYLNIAEESLEELICTSIATTESETRTFDTRKDYSTAFVDIFTKVTEVKLNGEIVEADKYSVRQWDKRSAAWYNSLVFEDKFKKGDDIEVTAEWGFEESSSGSSLPADLQAVLAGLFSLVTKKNKFDSTVSSKQVEDFRISFNTDMDLDQEFYAKYRMTLAKYSLCDIGNVQHGKVGYGYRSF